MFLKEGLMMDPEHQEAIMKLQRYSNNIDNSIISLDDYVARMKPSQDKIYFISTQSREQAMNSPFLEIFADTDIPVLILT